jgi:hypothetical protein
VPQAEQIVAVNVAVPPPQVVQPPKAPRPALGDVLSGALQRAFFETGKDGTESNILDSIAEYSYQSKCQLETLAVNSARIAEALETLVEVFGRKRPHSSVDKEDEPVEKQASPAGSGEW